MDTWRSLYRPILPSIQEKISFTMPFLWVEKQQYWRLGEWHRGASCSCAQPDQVISFQTDISGFSEPFTFTSRESKSEIFWCEDTLSIALICTDWLQYSYGTVSRSLFCFYFQHCNVSRKRDIPHGLLPKVNATAKTHNRCTTLIISHILMLGEYIRSNKYVFSQVMGIQ